jgi:hypothetical protein
MVKVAHLPYVHLERKKNPESEKRKKEKEDKRKQRGETGMPSRVGKYYQAKNILEFSWTERGYGEQ